MTHPPGSNGHSDPPGPFRKPAPHAVPSLAAQMADADAQQAAARMQAILDDVDAMRDGDAPAFLRLLDGLFAPVIANAVAAGVQAGIERATAAQAAQMEQAAKDAAGRQPLLRAMTGNVHMAAQAALGTQPPMPGPPAQ